MTEDIEKLEKGGEEWTFTFADEKIDKVTVLSGHMRKALGEFVLIRVHEVQLC